MSSGAIAVLISTQRYKDRNLLCAEVSQATMSRIRKVLLTMLSCSLLGASLGASQALASHGQANYFEASNLLLSPSTRPHAIAQMEHLGVKAIRLEVYWGNIVPSRASATEPAGFEATNPASYEWAEYDAVIAEAKRLHWKVLMTIAGPAPRWATANGQAPYITRPDDKDFEEFATALGRHFGSEVSLFSIWNEPNEPSFLLPQFNANGTPASGRIYRGLYQAGYAGLQKAGIANPKVLFGETAPVGYENVKSLLRIEKSAALLHPVSPLTFLRESLCLSAKYKKSSSCSELQMAGYSHHAYTQAAGPHWVPPKEDVTIGVLSRLSSALSRAESARAIPRGTAIYLTEFGVQSKPNKYEGVPVSVQAEYDAISEHIAYNNPRVAAFSQYLLKDDALGGKPGASVHGGTVGFQTGLEYSSGSPKPLYYAWPVPLTVTKTHSGVSLWGLVRPAAGATKVTVLVKAKGSKRYRTLKTVKTNSAGYWSLSSSTKGEVWRVSWTSPQKVKYEGAATHAAS
jgi:hypothetical protein